MISPPSFYYVEIASAKSTRKELIGKSLFPVLLKMFKCYAYTDPVSPSWLGDTSLYNVAMQRVAFPWPMNIFHYHLPTL